MIHGDAVWNENANSMVMNPLDNDCRVLQKFATGSKKDVNSFICIIFNIFIAKIS
jgi:hypothetical protein